MGIKIEVKTNLAGSLAANLQRELDRAVRETAFAIEAEAKQRAPVDTGALRASIQAGADHVAVGMEYGPHVEFGTVEQSAQPFLTPAVEAQREHFEQRVADAIERAARE
jgi:HK97 gp10 family phage protein